MSTLRAHLAILRDLAAREPGSPMLMWALIGCLEDPAEEVERLAAGQPADPPNGGDNHLGSI